MKSVVIIAPNSFGRLTGVQAGLATGFQLVTRTGHFATLPNLKRIVNSAPGKMPGLLSGRDRVNPMAGYYLESFLKRHCYDARVVFDWATDTPLLEALDPEPVAVLFSTTFVPTRDVLEPCLVAVRSAIGTLPLIVGGPLIWKQRFEIDRYASRPELSKARRQRMFGGELIEGLTGFGVDVTLDNIFCSQAGPQLQNTIFVASEFGEYTLLKVLEKIESGAKTADDFEGLPNVAVAGKDGRWRIGPIAPEPMNLDRDFTRWDLIEDPPRVVPMRTSVGCPYRCTYCDFIELHPKVLMRSTESILEEIRLLKACGRNFVNFTDDNIFLSTKRVSALAKALIESEAAIRWGGFFRVDRVDESNVVDLARSGCMFGLCGIESGDPGVLRLMQKGCDQDEIQRGIQLCSDAGIYTHLTFICGFPGETEETIDNTIEFINRLRPGKASPCYQVYPYFVLATTAADDPRFRALHDLHGRGAEWSHATMNADEVGERWAPYMFKGVGSIPYDYFGIDTTLFMPQDKRTRAYGFRKDLTVAFLEQAEDGVLQGHFEGLIRTLVKDPEQPVPHWSAVLAGREAQPKPRPRLPGPFATAAPPSGEGAASAT